MREGDLEVGEDEEDSTIKANTWDSERTEQLRALTHCSYIVPEFYSKHPHGSS